MCFGTIIFRLGEPISLAEGIASATSEKASGEGNLHNHLTNAFSTFYFLERWEFKPICPKEHPVEGRLRKRRLNNSYPNKDDLTGGIPRHCQERTSKTSSTPSPDRKRNAHRFWSMMDPRTLLRSVHFHFPKFNRRLHL